MQIPAIDKSKAGVGKSRNTKYQQAYSRFRAEIYQKVLGTVFHSWYDRSHDGEALECGDKRARILHPGVLIKSMDAQEHAESICVRHASAELPCPQCLVKDKHLADLCRVSPPRTVANMREALEKARVSATATERNAILQQNGIHDLEVRLPDLLSYVWWLSVRNQAIHVEPSLFGSVPIERLRQATLPGLGTLRKARLASYYR